MQRVKAKPIQIHHTTLIKFITIYYCHSFTYNCQVAVILPVPIKQPVLKFVSFWRTENIKS